jgi:hypothetical protein
MVRNGMFVGGNAEGRSEVLKKKEFRVTVDLGLGEGQATVFTNDLSYDYVKINADYRTLNEITVKLRNLSATRIGGSMRRFSLLFLFVFVLVCFSSMSSSAKVPL